MKYLQVARNRYRCGLKARIRMHFPCNLKNFPCHLQVQAQENPQRWHELQLLMRPQPQFQFHLGLKGLERQRLRSYCRLQEAQCLDPALLCRFLELESFLDQLGRCMRSLARALAFRSAPHSPIVCGFDWKLTRMHSALKILSCRLILWSRLPLAWTASVPQLLPQLAHRTAASCLCGQTIDQDLAFLHGYSTCKWARLLLGQTLALLRNQMKLLEAGAFVGLSDKPCPLEGVWLHMRKYFAIQAHACS